MKRSSIIIAFIAVISSCISCGSAETKADVSDTLKSEKQADKPANQGPSTRSITNPGSDKTSIPTNAANPGSDKTNILTNIDTYLVSNLGYPAPGTLTVENKIPEIMIQKAIVEVTITKENGDPLQTDFYILDNIESGGSKAAKIKVAGPGTKASAHILKLKCDDLTGGELIMVGSKYVPK